MFDGKKLPLTNSGELEVFFLGTGSAFSEKLPNTNFILIKGDTHLLVDFGVTGPDALRQNAGLDPTDINSVLLTHAHADHVGGVEQLAFMNYFIAKKKPDLIATPEFADVLWDRTLRGGMTYLTGCDRPLRLTDYFNLRLFTNWHQTFGTIGVPDNPLVYYMDYGSMKIELFRTKHIETPAGEPPFFSYGLCVDRKVMFSGDSLIDKNRLYRHLDCEAIFHDCSLKDSGGTHANLEDLRKLPDAIKQKMWLVHYQDDFREHDISDFAGWAEARTRYIFE